MSSRPENWERKMLWAVFSLLVVLWLIFGAGSAGSASIHLLLIAALVVLAVNLIRRKPAV